MQLNNPSITLQSSSGTAAPVIDITEEVASCTFDVSRAVKSRNTFGTDGQQRNKKGRFDGELTIDFNQNYSSSGAITRMLWSYLIAEDPVIVVIVADGDASVSTSNPEWTFQIAVDSLPVIDGNADDLATATVTYPMHGEPAIATS